ncbi:hypothetical protein LAC81_32505 [Ensifer adhaerens]|uniref:hypothetical protein n=1 Tax=Ensifer TaxID=106591 RepID=UPI000DE3BEC9|nr:hypothetical protein [Ensifer adhaerens]MBZ7925464.1 hypothetical protein [Ensifer adhaerens]UAX95376.1 hypothetical protein LAC78_31325 [Ensifer adhaerens]UAY02732.1 hypothetical protein LAC80_28985 [Ensifer adhaerens]UAY10716.1 hypothetical protein LAC81_32505 [Ensifer adhaerens]
MSFCKRTGIIWLVLAAALFIGDLTGEALSIALPSFVSPAIARVGRPLTPVSVAGVARRTTRRCAAGVYYC